MDVSDKCRVDLCDRRAAASIIRDNLPGPFPSAQPTPRISA